uniref:Large ribosomal subunit protein P2 n=1 Tax=Cyprinus carpio TaxID=7962 RepID=A0A8C2F6Z4_CYPCA
MRYVAAYLLAVLGGNNNPSAKDIKNILGSVGIEADDERLNKVISELNGKDINEVMNAGKAALNNQEKKEEKKEESEESDEDMGFGLFD